MRSNKACERARKNFDIRKTSWERENSGSSERKLLAAETTAHICYGPEPKPSLSREQRRHDLGRRYRAGGTTRISLPQAINFKSAVDFSASIGTPLTAHCIIHWVGTDAGDDPTGELFAEVREQLSRWLRYRGVPLAAVWSRERLSGGQAEVEHGHLLFHLPDAWLKGAKLISVSGGLEGGVKLQDVQAALYRIVMKLKIPTDGGNPAPYNGRSYDGLYLLKGRGKQAWKLFPRIKQEWRKPQGVIFGKRCGCTQSLGPTARRRSGHDGESDLWQRARDLKLKSR